MYKVVIIGAGGHGRVIADIIVNNGDFVVGFLDDNYKETKVNDYTFLGRIDEYVQYKDKYFIIGIGNNEIRQQITNRLKNINYYTAIHKTAYMATHTKIGRGTVIMPNAVINTNSLIGEHCIINTGAIIEHDNIIEDYVHISPNATLCGTVSIGELTHIGASATVKNNVAICHNVLVGVGGVVVKDIIEKGTYVGVPVRKIN